MPNILKFYICLYLANWALHATGFGISIVNPELTLLRPIGAIALFSFLFVVVLAGMIDGTNERVMLSDILKAPWWSKAVFAGSLSCAVFSFLYFGDHLKGFNTVPLATVGQHQNAFPLFMAINSLFLTYFLGKINRLFGVFK